jgi:hypothetical protein
MTARVIGAGLAALLSLAACALPPPIVREVSNPDASGPGLSPSTPKPGNDTYDEHACGGDHGMLEEVNDDDRGRIRLGPPQMSICR